MLETLFLATLVGSAALRSSGIWRITRVLYHPIKHVGEVRKTLQTNPTMFLGSLITGGQSIGSAVVHEFVPAEFAMIVIPGFPRTDVRSPKEFCFRKIFFLAAQTPVIFFTHIHETILQRQSLRIE